MKVWELKCGNMKQIVYMKLWGFISWECKTTCIYEFMCIQKWKNIKQILYMELWKFKSGDYSTSWECETIFIYEFMWIQIWKNLKSTYIYEIVEIQKWGFQHRSVYYNI